VYRVTYVIGTMDPLERAAAVGKILRALTRMDADWLRAHPETPRIEAGKVKQVPEPRDVDEWHDIPTLFRTGHGTLPELLCWGAAQAYVKDGKSLQVPVLHSLDPEQGRFVLATDLFHGDAERALSHRVLAHMLVGLTAIDEMLLLRHPEWPDLYESGVHYQEEPVGQEDWQDAPTCIRLGNGDCEDLACWRAAELRIRYGMKGARPSFLWRRKPETGSYLYHIQVVHPDGRTEDPSRRLGMR
jgi:hypothetical protein